MPGIDYAAVRALISITDVLEHLQFRPVRRRGNWIRGSCPVCRSDNPRAFAANVVTNRYYCHHCKRGGTQLDLWSAAAGLPLYQATRRLCLRHQIPVPEIYRW